MTVTAIVGANWGDEGKGKATDCLAADADFVVRFQGGSNAGHTIINDYGKFALHLLPSGVFYPHTTNVLGPGVAVNMGVFLRELAELKERGVPEPNLRISDRAQVILPYHVLLDEYEEERLSDRKFGSTKQGISPFYTDKYQKIGVQIADLYDEERLITRLKSSLSIKNVLLENLYHKPTLDAEEIAAALMPEAEQIKPFVCDTTVLLHEGLSAGKTILVEGQLGALRDPDHGIYPYPTSSSPLAGFATVGAGIPATAMSRVVSITKAYSSCVGAGPFVSEIFGDEAEELRKRGGDAGEYGATTGRPRRVGWFDVVATRYGCRVQGTTEVYMSNLDVLAYLDEIPVCVGYEIDGEITRDFPNSARLEFAKPVYETLPGWKVDISGVRDFAALPQQAQDYVLHLEKLIGFPIKWMGVGPRRDEMIVREV
ncbi:MAG: adenylosuccinate synthase [Chloroflexota bacterium]